MRWLVAGWIGSTNLGDELVHAGLRRHLDALDVTAVPISVDPAATVAVFGGSAVGHTDPGLWRVAGEVDAAVLGGGGLVQDETSALNLPYHLARVALARARGLPVAGVGLGVGPVHRSWSRRMVAAALRRCVAVTVRDRPSAQLLRSAGVDAVEVTADLALGLEPVETAADDVVTVCLRPWRAASRGLIPVSRRQDDTPEWFLDEAAVSLDATAALTGLEVRFVALQTDRDDALHRRIAQRMRTPASCVVPDLHTVVEEVARGRAVVAMRYHGAISAVLGARPVVQVGYSPKVEALAADLDLGSRVLPFAPGALDGLPTAVEELVAGGRAPVEGLLEARARLRDREHGNRRALERLAEVAGG